MKELKELSVADLYAFKSDFQKRWSACMERKSYKYAEYLLSNIERIDEELLGRTADYFGILGVGK